MANIDVYSSQKLDLIIDKNGIVNNSLVIRGTGIQNLGRLKKVKGDLGIICDSLTSLSSLNFVEGDFWISSAKNLQTLGSLEKVKGDVYIGKSEITDLGNLSEVGGKLSLRRTKINDISKLRKVAHLDLPEEFKEIDLKYIQFENISYFKIKKNEKKIDKKSIKDVGGDNLRYDFQITNQINQYTDYWKHSKFGISFYLKEYGIPKNPLESYYVPPNEIEIQNQNFETYKSELINNQNFLQDFEDDNLIYKFYHRLIYHLFKEFASEEISKDDFIEKLLHYELIFTNFSIPNKTEFFLIYNHFERDDILLQLSTERSEYLSFSQIHELELKLKTKILSGKRLIKCCSYLNEYIKNNIQEFELFLDNKLIQLYQEKTSFFDTFFCFNGTIEEINNLFPLEYREFLKKPISRNDERKKEFDKFIILNSRDGVLSKFLTILDSFSNSEIIKMKKSQQYEGELWLSYYDVPFDNGTYNFTEFVFFLNNLFHQLFVQITLGTQNEFRISKGIPKIGEGWVSETELYYMLKEEFHDKVVQHHGKPIWLGRQHVDIWFPEYGIGIEYQGIQHDQPIDFFGGSTGFESNKKRDERKKKLFTENNCQLIEVRENYNFTSLVHEIKKYMG